MLPKTLRNYKGHECNVCSVPVTTGSKSGKCKSCSRKSFDSRLNKKCGTCSLMFKVYPSREGYTKFCSRICQSISKIGVKLPRDRVLKSIKGHQGAKSHFWRGGITPKNRLIRGSFLYKEWRKSVFGRDNYTCQFCKVRGVFLQADHIKPFAYFPELRFELSNGRTLCLPCHKETETYAGKVHNYMKREFAS